MSLRKSVEMAVALAVLLVLPTFAPATSRAMGSAAANSQTRRLPWQLVRTRAKYLVLFVLDGARPDYVGLTRLPHLDALRTSGTQFTNAIDGILESETPAGHTTLSTGSTPRRDGILGFNWAQNDNDYSLFSPNVVRSGAIERIMQQQRVPTIAGLYKAHFPSAKVVALSGHKYYAADPLGGPKADAIMYYQGDPHGRYVPVAIPGHVPPPQVLNARGLVAPSTNLKLGTDDHLANMLALSAFRVIRQRITLINEPEFDWPLGHVDGGDLDRAKTIQLMQAFDRDLGAIEAAYRRAGVLKKTLFVITADHGMAPVTHFVPSTVITDAVAKAGTTAPSIAYNQSAYVWLKDFNKAPIVAQNIMRGPHTGVKAVYYLTYVGRQQRYVRASGAHITPGVEAANQYLLSTLFNGHQPTLVIFCRTDSTFSAASNHWRADHGGATWQSQHIPLILSGPGVRRGVVTGAPAQLEDVAPTILTDMGVTPKGMQGHILTDALQRAGRARKSRSGEISFLQPLVQALVLEDARERARPTR